MGIENEAGPITKGKCPQWVKEATKRHEEELRKVTMSPPKRKDLEEPTSESSSDGDTVRRAKKWLRGQEQERTNRIEKEALDALKAEAEEEAKKVSGAAARRKCEQIARYLTEALKLEGQEPTILHVQDAFKGWVGNNSTNRKTASGGKEPIQSDTFGLVKDHNQAFPTVGVRSTEYPELTKLVNWWARLNCGPNFKWTTFTINHNWSSKAHRDKNNVGMSMITAMGEFVGGSLVVYNNDDRKTKPDQWDIRDLSDVTEHDIKCKSVFFNGKNIHRTMPFEGNRTSIIFFESKHLTGGCGQNTHESTDDEMRKMGFRPYLKGVYGGSPSAVKTVQVKMLYVSPDGAVNPLHRDLGRNGGVEDPNLEHAEITPSDDEHEQEEANPKKKMRGSPKPDDQPAHDDECMDEIFNTRKHDTQVTLPDLETAFLNDAVLKDTVVRCGDEKGRLIPEEGY